MDKRTQIIQRAIQDKFGLNIEIFSADDILQVANISLEEATAIYQEFAEKVNRLADKS